MVVAAVAAVAVVAVVAVVLEAKQAMCLEALLYIHVSLESNATFYTLRVQPVQSRPSSCWHDGMRMPQR
jgi:hypothetical protein